MEQKRSKSGMIEELISYIEEIKKIKSDKYVLFNFEEEVLRIADPQLSLCFAKKIKWADVKAHGQVIIDSGGLYYNYAFARDVEGADVRAHGQIIIDSRDLVDNYKFARDVKGADVKAHGQVIIDSRDLYYNYQFADKIVGADVRAHGQVIIDSGNSYYIECFLSDIDFIDCFLGYERKHDGDSINIKEDNQTTITKARSLIKTLLEENNKPKKD